MTHTGFRALKFFKLMLVAIALCASNIASAQSMGSSNAAPQTPPKAAKADTASKRPLPANAGATPGFTRINPDTEIRIGGTVAAQGGFRSR